MCGFPTRCRKYVAVYCKIFSRPGAFPYINIYAPFCVSDSIMCTEQNHPRRYMIFIASRINILIVHIRNQRAICAGQVNIKAMTALFLHSPWDMGVQSVALGHICKLHTHTNIYI